MVRWREEDQALDGWLAAALLACGTLSRPHVALLGGSNALTMMHAGRREWVRRLWPVAPGSALMAAFVFRTRDPVLAPTFAIRGPAAYSQPVWVVANGLTYAFHFAVTVPLALPWILTHYRTMPKWMAGGSSLVTMPVFTLGRSFPRQDALFMAASFWLLGDLARRSWDQRTRVLSAWLLIPLAALPYVPLPAKYGVACAPAA